MSTLVVIGYDNLFKAQEVRLMLAKMQKDYLIDLEDAVVAVKDDKGKVKLHQAFNLTAAGAVSGGFWGTLIGLIFLNPLLGLAVGATAGAVSGALTDVGVDDKFMKELAGQMNLGSSVLFILVRKATPDKVLEEIKDTGGKILKTSLSHDDEAKLQAALAAAGFTMKRTDTPEKLAALQGLPQHQVMAGVKDGKMIYLYADATTCKCLYLGNEKAYQNYRRFALEKQIAMEDLYSPQTSGAVDMDWGMLGQWGFDVPME